MRAAFPKVYRSFAEFEKEELHKLDSLGSFDEMLDEMFVGELDFGDGDGRKSRRRAEEDDE